MTITVTPNWQRAMERAKRDGLKATRCLDGTYRVASTSNPGAFHTVLLDERGQIIHCTECKGWENGGRERPCKHAGSVAIALAYLKGGHIRVVTRPAIDVGAIETKTRRSQLYRTER